MLAAFIIGILIVGILIKPLLPLPQVFSAITQSRGLHPIHGIRRLLHATGATTIAPLAVKPEITDAINMAGFYVEWDDSAFASLKQNISKLELLVPEEFGIAPGGNILLRNPDKFARTMDFVHANNPNTQVLPLINNYDATREAWDSTELHAILSQTGSRMALVDHLVQFTREKEVDGINVDFEEIRPDTLPYYYVFLKALGDQLHADGRILQVDVPV